MKLFHDLQKEIPKCGEGMTTVAKWIENEIDDMYMPDVGFDRDDLRSIADMVIDKVLSFCDEQIKITEEKDGRCRKAAIITDVGCAFNFATIQTLKQIKEKLK